MNDGTSLNEPSKPTGCTPWVWVTHPYCLILAVLVVACFLPRAWLACGREVICPDGVAYLRISEALQQGDLDRAFQYLNLNIYPVILWALRGIGTNWEAACQWWGVLMATLAVLPLFGLVRRMLDDRTAVVACILYAVHPRLLAYSPLILRDPTHWFLFFLSLYLMWRAATEVRWWLFLASGVAFTLALHNRSEAWLLLIPLGIWTAWRWGSVAGRRKKLLAGTAACLAVVPISVLLVNVTWLRDHPQWELGRMSHFVYAGHWARSAAQADVPDKPVTSARPRVPTVVAARKVIVRLVKTLTYAYGLLALAGLWRCRRFLWRGDLLPLLLIGLVMFTGIVIRFSLKPIDERYYLTILLVSLPCMALGVMQCADWASGSLRRYFTTLPIRHALITAGLLAPLVLSGVYGGARYAESCSQPWRHQAELGKWILGQYGPDQEIRSNTREYRLVGYYARGHTRRYGNAQRLDVEKLLALIDQERPEVLVLWNSPISREETAARTEILLRRAAIGYRRIPEDDLPANCREAAVLVRVTGTRS